MIYLKIFCMTSNLRYKEKKKRFIPCSVLKFVLLFKHQLNNVFFTSMQETSLFFWKELLLSLLSSSCEVIQTECWNKPIKEAIHLHKWKGLSQKLKMLLSRSTGIPSFRYRNHSVYVCINYSRAHVQAQQTIMIISFLSITRGWE